MSLSSSWSCNKTLARSAVNFLFALFESKGHLLYGEEISLLQHSLQCAALAQRRVTTSSPSMVTAALLHDVGQMFTTVNNDIEHPKAGAEFLSHLCFPQSVTMPILLHAEAKRFLITSKPQYRKHLSAASRESLKVQGSLMSSVEMENFRQHPYFKEAVQLREWDDAAKQLNVIVPPLEHYRQTLLNTLSIF